MGFQGSRNLDRIGRVARRRVCDRHNRHHLAPFHDLARGNDGAGTVFAAFLCAVAVFSRPQIRIGNHKAGLRCRKTHGAQSSTILSRAA